MGDKKRKKPSPPDSKRLFLEGTQVEVKSIEDGLQGSWHPAKIFKSRGQERIIEYCNLLDDDSPSLSPLIEQIDVSGILDGFFSRSDLLKNNRGRLRPAPQIRKPSRESISYGLCVDAYHEDAWWEGVVIDQKEENSDNRQVFFPDLGDELMSDIKSLRITYDWNEVTDEWKPRGNWVFLDIIHSLEFKYPILVSIKQLWYDVRQRKEFPKNGDWAFQDKLLWKKLLLEVINDYMDLAGDEARSLCELWGALLENVDAVRKSVPSHEPSTSYSQAIVASRFQDGGLMIEKDKDSLDSTRCPMVAACSSEQVAHVQPKPLSVIPFEMSDSAESGNNEGSSAKMRLVGKLKFKIKSGSGNYCLSSEHQTPVAPKSELQPRFCPQSITEYLASGDRPPNYLTNNVRNHLLSLGWKLDYCYRKPSNHARVYYISPDGKKYYCLRQLLEKLGKSLMENSPPIIIDAQERVPLSPDENTVQLDSEPHVHCLQTGRTKSTGAIVVSKSEIFPVVPEFCPEAVSGYLMHPKDDEWLKKARQHLLSIGWKCWFQHKKGKHKEEWRYDSPTSGKTYISLRSACRAIEEGNEENPEYSCSPPIKDAMCIEGPKPQLGCELSLINAEGQKDLSQTRSVDGITVGKSLSVRNRRLSKRKKTLSSLLENNGSTSWVKNANQCEIRRSSSSISSKKQKVGKVRSSSNDNGRVTRVLRSSKRVKVGPSSQVARTLLSWLIDNKVIMARKKVFYRKKRDSSVMLEGRIARDGIKCTCCQKLVSLSGFAAHARSTCQHPAANIFTEDGKSLVECQLLVLQSKLRSSSRKPLESVRKYPHKWNDHICSICHYGGNLILCDQCPSSFHAECLNLQDIPDGDWFCPACRCGICGFCQFDADTKQFADRSALCCYQCERKYHAHCIRKRDTVELSGHPKENWFCCRTCEKVHWGLQQLLGKRILVGHDNLTWTLVKPILPDDGDHDDCDFVTMAEYYGKLSLALEVMHECFEPVIDPTTKQDVVENLIFSRGSDLNRLNFRGFYTVLLERDDALISVALVRVHGNKVAEIPFVATRFKHRRHGMCRILMNEIEKNLLNLKVERLVLPAAGSVLNTWTTSFGFSPVTQTDRSEFLGYTLLDFQDSVMCQKLLMKHSSALSLLLRDVPGAHCEPCQDGNCNGLKDFEGNSGISNVFLEERRRGSEIVDQGEQLDCAEDKSYSGSVATDCSPPIVSCLMVGGATDQESEQCGTLKQKKVEGDSKSEETQMRHLIVTDCPTPMVIESTSVDIEQRGTSNQNKLEGDNKSDATLKDYQRKNTIEPLTISQVHPPKVEVSCR